MRNIPYPPERIEDGLGFLANQLSFALRQNVGRECEAAGYKATPEGLGILFLLSRQDGLTQSQISEFLAKDKAAITRLLNALEKEGLAGLLPRRPGPKRAHKLTDEVMAFIDEELREGRAVSSEEMSQRVEERFGLSVHPRSIERALARREKKRRRSS